MIVLINNKSGTDGSVQNKMREFVRPLSVSRMQIHCTRRCQNEQSTGLWLDDWTYIWCTMLLEFFLHHLHRLFPVSQYEIREQQEANSYSYCEDWYTLLYWIWIIISQAPSKAKQQTSIAFQFISAITQLSHTLFSLSHCFERTHIKSCHQSVKRSGVVCISRACCLFKGRFMASNFTMIRFIA